MANESADKGSKVDSTSEAAKISIAKPAEKSSTSADVVTDKEKEEAINQQAKVKKRRQWTLCITFWGVCVLAGIGLLLARCYCGETDLLLVCRDVVLAGLLGARMWAERLEAEV
ncbi:hypothetical protein LTR17_000487 [Elasticomyces elasticus]|nr:hypothetical protein LTR17_000487 [Elasticomyces elasticus]